MPEHLQKFYRKDTKLEGTSFLPGTGIPALVWSRDGRVGGEVSHLLSVSGAVRV